MGTISKNFSYREFEDSRIADDHGICNVITSFSVRDAVQALTLEVLQPLRDAIGLPVVISSGYRVKALNTLIGGSASSQHMKGEAADIYVLKEDGTRYDSEQLALVVAALQLPYDQLIVYESFIHVSHKLKGEQRGRIMFDKSYTGLKV